MSAFCSDSPGRLLRSRREANGLTQQRLALRAGTTQAAISRIERDAVSPTFTTLSGLLGVMGESLDLSSHRPEPEVDRVHLADALARAPEQRIELALSWNRMAGEVARAGAAARARG